MLHVKRIHKFINVRKNICVSACRHAHALYCTCMYTYIGMCAIMYVGLTVLYKIKILTSFSFLLSFFVLSSFTGDSFVQQKQTINKVCAVVLHCLPKHPLSLIYIYTHVKNNYDFSTHTPGQLLCNLITLSCFMTPAI